MGGKERQCFLVVSSRLWNLTFLGFILLCLFSAVYLWVSWLTSPNLCNGVKMVMKDDDITWSSVWKELGDACKSS